MSKYHKKNDTQEFNRLQVEKYAKDGCYLVVDPWGDLRCADNYDHALEISETQELTLLALNEKDADDLRNDWKLDHKIPCPAIKILEIQEGETP